MTMGSGRRYTDEQIMFVLELLVEGRTREQVVRAFTSRFPSHPYPFGPKQVKYIKQGYGKHPDYG